MKKFSYSLAGVLRVRKTQEDQVKAVIAKYVLERKELKEKAERFNREMVDCRARLCQPGQVDPHDFTQNERYMQGLAKEIKRLIEKVQLVDIKIENYRRELKQKRQATRQLEIHEEHERETWEDEYSRKEQADFDDLASTRKRFLSE